MEKGADLVDQPSADVEPVLLASFRQIAMHSHRGDELQQMVELLATCLIGQGCQAVRDGSEGNPRR